MSFYEKGYFGVFGEKHSCGPLGVNNQAQFLINTFTIYDFVINSSWLRYSTVGSVKKVLDQKPFVFLWEGVLWSVWGGT